MSAAYLYIHSYNIGSALGATISGAIWYVRLTLGVASPSANPHTPRAGPKSSPANCKNTCKTPS